MCACARVPSTTDGRLTGRELIKTQSPGLERERPVPRAGVLRGRPLVVEGGPAAVLKGRST